LQKTLKRYRIFNFGAQQEGFYFDNKTTAKTILLSIKTDFHLQKYKFNSMTALHKKPTDFT